MNAATTFQNMTGIQFDLTLANDAAMTHSWPAEVQAAFWAAVAEDREVRIRRKNAESLAAYYANR